MAYGTAKWVKALTWILIVLVIVAAGGFLASLTGGDEQSFYLEIGNKTIKDSASGFEFSSNEPTTITLKPVKGEDSLNGYEVKIVPNTDASKDFDYTVDGEWYSFQGIEDLTDGFEIEYEDESFTIIAVGNVGDILQSVHGDAVVADADGKGYRNMFTMLVTSHDEETTIRVDFTVPEEVFGVELDKEAIEF